MVLASDSRVLASAFEIVGDTYLRSALKAYAPGVILGYAAKAIEA